MKSTISTEFVKDEGASTEEVTSYYHTKDTMNTRGQVCGVGGGIWKSRILSLATFYINTIRIQLGTLKGEMIGVHRTNVSKEAKRIKKRKRGVGEEKSNKAQKLQARRKLMWDKCQIV